MSYYDDVETMLLQRGEQLVPFACFDEPRDWEGIYECWKVIIAAGERPLNSEEILKFYDRNPRG